MIKDTCVLPFRTIASDLLVFALVMALTLQYSFVKSET
jgi:hypothetical protein